MNNESTTKKFRILHSNSGASLLFVLAVMFLLLAIGISVLVAAGAGRGAMARQAEHNQVRLLDESVQQSIMQSLTNSEDGNSLGARLLHAIYAAGAAGGELGNIVFSIDFEDDFSISNPNNNVWISDNGITLELIEQDIQITPAIPQIFEVTFDDDGVQIDTPARVSSRVPRTAVISLKIEVTVRIETPGDPIHSITQYIFEGAEFGFRDGPLPLPGALPLFHECTHPACYNRPCPQIFPTGMTLIEGGGTWRVVSRGMMIHGREPIEN